MIPIILTAPTLKVDGMALYPFILIRDKKFKNDAVFINHERIHLRQQIELLILPFYVLYLLNYLVNLWRCRNHDKAYIEISFEREAYANERDLAYLNRRRWFSWRRYL